MSLETTGSMTAEDFKAAPTAAGFVKNDASGNFLLGETGSAWTLLETKSISVATQSITFDNSGSLLNGDTDRAYRLIYECPLPLTATDSRWELRPNGLTANQRTVVFEVNNIGTLSAYGYTSGLLFSNTILPVTPGPMYVFGMLEFYADRGPGGFSSRLMKATEIVSAPGVNKTTGTQFMGKWADSATLVTSLEIRSLQPTVIEAGSKWSLYKIDYTP